MNTTILTPEQKEQLTQKLDELIKLKGFAEMIDGPTIKILLGLLDNLATKYIPEEYHAALREVVNGFLAS
jgi:hypothetical protein